MTRLFFLALLLGISQYMNAQSTNIFLDRSYWKGQPGIEDITKKIKEGNSISEFNENQFDAVVYAIIEKMPTETVKYLLKDPANNVHKITHDGRTYLFWAAYAGDVALMEYLINQGSSVELIDEHGNTPLIFAASNGQLNTAVYDVLVKAGASLSKEKSRSGANALLLIAPYLQGVDQINYFTEHGLDLNSMDDLGNGIFNHAARNGNIQLLDALIAKGVHYKELNKENGNAIHFACQGSRSVSNGVPVFEYLVGKGIDPTATTTEGVNALHILASRCKDPEVINYFLKLNANPNATTVEGNTPLMIAAAAQRSIDIIKQFVAVTDDINKANNEGTTALALAVQSNSDEAVQILLESGANGRQFKDKAGNGLTYYLIQSYRPGKLDEFNAKLETLKQFDVVLDNAALDTIQGNGNTALHLAVAKNDLDLVKRIYNFGWDINLKNGDGLTALHIAAMKAQDDQILQFLISKGADRSIKTDFEESAYDLAKENELLNSNKTNIKFLK